MRVRLGVLGAVIGVIGGLARAGFAEQRATDETIAELFQRSHTVMKAQRANLHAVLDGFLAGDLQLIQRSAQDIAAGMQDAARSFPPRSGQEAEQWEAMAGVARSAEAMGTAARQGKHELAYQHFTAMTRQCMACHQIRRDWGTFPASNSPDGAEATSPLRPPPPEHRRVPE